MITSALLVLTNSNVMSFGLPCGISPKSRLSAFQVTVFACCTFTVGSLLFSTGAKDISPNTSAKAEIFNTFIFLVFKFYNLMIQKYNLFRNSVVNRFQTFVNELLTVGGSP